MLESNEVGKVFAIEEFSETENWFTYDEFYKQVAQDPNLRFFVEVGSWKGHSTCHLAHYLQETGKDFVLFAVDLWDKLPKDNELRIKYPEQVALSRQIFDHNLRRTNTTQSVAPLALSSLAAASLFETGALDFVFLDASHDGESVTKDLEAWFPKVRIEGMIAGHDINDLAVATAVSSFFDKKGLTLMVHEEQNLWAVVVKPVVVMA